MIYLDSSATSYLKPDSVKKAVFQSFSYLGNAGRGAHEPTLLASRLIYDTRCKLAQLFDIEDPSDIAFTNNATESLNIAIQGLIDGKDHVISSVCEHNSVLRPLYRKELEGACVDYLTVDEKGRIDYKEIEKLIRKDTKAIVITHASNLTGNSHDLFKIHEILTRYAQFGCERKPFLIVDASQTAGILPVSVKKMGIDVLCFTGHKGLFGPQGTGGIYVRKNVNIPSFKVGGSGIHSFDKDHPSIMPTVLEAGTLNGHGLAGLHAGVEYILQTGMESIHHRERKLADRFYQGIKNIPGIKVYGDYEMEGRAPIVAMNLADMDSAVVSDILWEDYKICTRAGAHCAPRMHEALGTVDQGIVRFSFSCFNTEEEIDLAIAAIKELAEEE